MMKVSVMYYTLVLKVKCYRNSFLGHMGNEIYLKTCIHFVYL